MTIDRWIAAGTHLRNMAHNGLMPAHCPLCLASIPNRFVVCHDCYRELPWLGPGCTTCAAPLPATATLSQCPSCLRQAPALDDCRALLEYRAPVDHWIQRLKFHQELPLAKLLGRLLAEHIPEGNGVRLVPVPLHSRRLRQRGFNQAREIARPLQRQNYRIDTRCCTRSRHTPPQSELSAKIRLDNLHDAFRVQREVSGETIVLVDDVLTTGATLNALARTLKNAGAARVEAWVIARTPEPGSRQKSKI